MPVPDTDTFSMQDVITEMNTGTTDLIGLFSLATGAFDPAYVGDKTNLLNFRNYNHNPIFSYDEFFIAADWTLLNATITEGVSLRTNTTDFTTGYGWIPIVGLPVGETVRLTASLGAVAFQNRWNLKNPVDLSSNDNPIEAIDAGTDKVIDVVVTAEIMYMSFYNFGAGEEVGVDVLAVNIIQIT